MDFCQSQPSGLNFLFGAEPRDKSPSWECTVTMVTMDSMVLGVLPTPALTLLTSQEKGILVTSEVSTRPKEKDSKSGWLIRHGGPPCGHCSLPTGTTTGLRLLHLPAMAPKLHQYPPYYRHIIEQPVSQGKGHVTWSLFLSLQKDP